MDTAGGLRTQARSGARAPTSSGSRKSRPLRFRLFLLAASGLVPLALVLLVFTLSVAQDRRTAVQAEALELSHALAAAVDAELRSTISLLINLSTASQLADLPVAQLTGEAFPALATRVAEQQGWRTLIVTDPEGQVLLRTAGGVSSGGLMEPASLEQVVRTGAPAVGLVARGPGGLDAFAVRIPVLREGQLRYVLSAVVPTTQMLNVVARQQLAPGWVVGVFDAGGNRVVRSPPTGPARYSPSLEALVRAGGQQGMGMTRTLEGVESHTGFWRVAASQWVVAVGIPAAAARADLYRLLAALGAGTAASLGLLAGLAWRMARRISGPIRALEDAAAALGTGQRVALPASGVLEIDKLGAALHRAAADRDEATHRRERVETEREQLLDRLENALQQAEQANRNKDEFLALLGHELRNPLAPIMNAVQLLQLKGDATTAHERGIIQRQLNYVTRLVDDLLDASRITSKRFLIHLRPLLAVPLLEQTLESIRPALGGRSLRLVVATNARPAWVLADETRLVQVFNNLLGNAIKFTGAAGAIEVHVTLVGEQELEVTVRDDGAGMAAAELAQAFELFYQAPNSARAVNGGLGLGLAIVKSLVEMHGGRVAVHSDGAGTGTAVTVTLPLTAAPGESPAPPVVDSAFALTRVLIVDDNVDAADTLAALLEVSGFQPEVAYTPEAALQIIGTFAAEIAILDIGLPGMDGYALARQLGAQGFRGRLVALTGYGQQQDVQKAMDAGFDAHLTKPVATDALLQLLSRLLSGGSQH